MAANNRGNMRPTSRSPPFLAIGLFVALVILGFNYWNLSVKNGEQYNEISVMERELKILSAKNTAVEKRAEAKDDKVNYLEEQLNKEKGTASEKAAALAAAQNERETLVQAKAALQTEFDMLKEKVPLCEKEVDSIKSSLEATKVELEQLKNAPAQTQTCGDRECSKYVSLSRDMVLEELLNTVGAAPLIALYKSGKDVGKFASQLKTYAESQTANANNNQVNAGQQGIVVQPNNVGGQQPIDAANQQVQVQTGHQNVGAEQQPAGQAEAGQQPVQTANNGTAADQRQEVDNQQPAAGGKTEDKHSANTDVQGQDPNVAGNNMEQSQGQVAAPIVGGADPANLTSTKDEAEQIPKPNTNTEVHGGLDKLDRDGGDDQVNTDLTNDDANNDDDDDGAGAIQADDNLNNEDEDVDNAPVQAGNDKREEYDDEYDEEEGDNALEADDDDNNDDDYENDEELRNDETGVEQMRMGMDNADKN